MARLVRNAGWKWLGGVVGGVVLWSTTPLSAQEGVVLPILDPVTLHASCEYMLEDAAGRAAQLESLPLDQATVESVLLAWDRASIAREDISGPVAILANVHPDPSVRAAAEQCLQKLSAFSVGLYQNEALYRRIEAVEPMDAIDRKLKEDLLESFEDTGVNLPPAERERAAEISRRLTELRQEFERNLRDDSTRLVFTPAEYEGVPESYLATVQRDADGRIELGMNSPEYGPFMRNALDEAARRRYYIAYQNVGAPRNLEILQEISTLRRELAALHGQQSYAEHLLRRRMAGSPQQVAEFLDEVQFAASDAEGAEIEELRRFKAQHTGAAAESTTLNRWDIAFYRERLREQRYAVDQEELRSYFPVGPTVQWVLDMSGRLYDVEFTERAVPVWHEEVRFFDLSDRTTGTYLGGLYLDLHPREGKYTHAAVWPVRRSSTQANRRPISVLVTNFDRKGLTQGELETFLHELGHALHNLFSSTRYNLHGGTAVEMDFVEAPSQMYEEWGRRPGTLAMIRESCPECPVLTPAQVEQLNAARRFGQGMAYADQRMFAAYDQALTGREPVEIMDAWREMESGTAFGTVEGTYFPARFGHLANHYGAGYYGYLWSEVIAIDLRSAFGENLMDPAVARRFREIVLSRGGERPAMEMVEEFLGREVGSEAFFDELRGGETP